MEGIGARIAKLRESTGYTQQDLAKVFGVSRSAVNAWEMGKSVPASQLMPQIARFFRVSTDFLYGMEASQGIDAAGLTDSDVEALLVMVNLLREKNQRQNNQRQSNGKEG